jgi:DNA-binding response OmpR family regulator
MRILLVEDDIGYLNCLMPEMARNYIVDIAHNSEDGAYLSEVNDYDAIVVDGSLHDCAAEDFCKKAKSVNNTASVLVLSKNYDYTNVINLVDSGVDLCIPKIAKPQDVCKGVQALLKKNNHVVNNVIKIGFINIDLKFKKVFIKNKEVGLRRKEDRKSVV